MMSSHENSQLCISPGSPGAKPTPAPPILFPQEIIDHIIDQLGIELINDWGNERPDSETLSACSLVCSSWLPRSSKYLFYSINLDCRWNFIEEESLIPFLANAKSSPRISSNVVFLNAYFKPTEEFVNDIFTTLPKLRSLIWKHNMQLSESQDTMPSQAELVISPSMHTISRGSVLSPYTSPQRR